MPELAFDTSEAFTLITQLLECLFFQFLASVALISWFCVQLLVFYTGIMAFRALYQYSPRKISFQSGQS